MASEGISLQIYLDGEISHVRTEIAALKELTAQARADDKEALRIATEALEGRLSLLNEFRQQSQDQSREYVKVGIYDERMGNSDKRMDDVSGRLSTMEGRFLGLSGVLTIIGIAGAFYALVK